MNHPKVTVAGTTLVLSILAMTAYAGTASDSHVADEVIAGHRATLAENTDSEEYGPQSPRDIDAVDGENERAFAHAPSYTTMNLCNIHMHEGAEHKGGEFTKYAGNGDGHGYGTGYLYTGKLSKAELADTGMSVGKTEHGELKPGDTIEVHYVHSTAKVKPGPTLGSCLSEATMNPQLRVETQVYVVVNDDEALDFMDLTKVDVVDGHYQALNIPTNMGQAVEYAGSTTGPGYNEKASPLQVTWNVRPKVAKVNIKTVGKWFENNIFDEDHAHGVRNLVKNPDLLSEIK